MLYDNSKIIKNTGNGKKTSKIESGKFDILPIMWYTIFGSVNVKSKTLEGIRCRLIHI